ESSVVGAGLERPAAEADLLAQAGPGGVGEEVGEVVAAPGAEADDCPAALGQVLGEAGEDVPAGARREEGHDVARADDQVEAAPLTGVVAQVELGEVLDVPVRPGVVL